MLTPAALLLHTVFGLGAGKPATMMLLLVLDLGRCSTLHIMR